MRAQIGNLLTGRETTTPLRCGYTCRAAEERRLAVTRTSWRKPGALLCAADLEKFGEGEPLAGLAPQGQARRQHATVEQAF